MRLCFVLFLCVFLTADVSAFLDPTSCRSRYDCSSVEPYCWGNSFLTMTCHSSPGDRGKHCAVADDLSCDGNLVCARVGVDDVCSECRSPDHQNIGLTWEGAIDEPVNSLCKEYGVTCSCVSRRPGGGVYRFARWEDNDDACDLCFEGSDCFTGLTCVSGQATSYKYCTSVPNFECCRSSDCVSSESCVNNLCVVTATTSTTSTTSTSTTTTTIQDAVFDCSILVNISKSSDDGYGVAVGESFTTDSSAWVEDWVGGGSLVGYNKSTDKNHSLGFIFRSVGLPKNAIDITSTVFLRVKGMEHFSQIGSCTAGSSSVDTLDFSNTSKPSTLDYFNSIDRTSCVDFTCSASSSAGCDTNFETGLNNTWYPDLYVNVGENLEFYNPGLWREDNNLTVFIQMSGLDETTTFFSYDDDPDYAPRLCLNYTLEDQVYFVDDCSSDTDCYLNEFCLTGFSDSKYCVMKEDDYLVDADSLCYRNHECKSGRCSSHTDNNFWGDYPVFDFYGELPYSTVGQCLPSQFTVKVGVVPSVVVVGQSFDVWGSVLDKSGVPGSSVDCYFYFDYLEPLNFRQNFSDLAWAGNSDEGYNWSIGHSMIFSDPGDTDRYKWTHKNQYSSSTINGFSREGFFGGWFSCAEPSGHLVGIEHIFEVRYQNYTTIEFLDYPKQTLRLGEIDTISLAYKNVSGMGLSDASCSVNVSGDVYTLTDTGGVNTAYSGAITFNKSGNVPIIVSCNLSTYESQLVYGSRYVQAGTCANGVKDLNEEGVDCGGLCVPCSESGLTPDFGSCNEDASCVSGWCNTEQGYCSTPTCFDGFRNNGEIRTDCGGLVCDPCPSCLQNNDCSVDGSQYCNATYTCEFNDCTVDSDCFTLAWFDFGLNTFTHRQTFCDGDGLCRFNVDVVQNQTFNEVGLDVSPLSGLTANVSGTIFNVFNCEDSNNGFILNSNNPTTVSYSFASSTFSPSIPVSVNQIAFGGVSAKTHRGIIPELCGSNADGVGGFGDNEVLAYSKINFRSCDSSKCENKIVDVVTFEKNIKSSANYWINASDTGSIIYGFNATGRSVAVMVRETTNHNWVNISTGFSNTQYLLINAFNDDLGYLDSYLFKINSSFGETTEGRVGDLLFMPIKFNPDSQKFELGFDLHGWMILPLFAGLIVFLAYLNYKGKRRGGFD